MKNNWRMFLVSSVSLWAPKLCVILSLENPSSTDSYVSTTLKALTMLSLKWRVSIWVENQLMSRTHSRKNKGLANLISMVPLPNELLLMQVSNRSRQHKVNLRWSTSKRTLHLLAKAKLKWECMTSKQLRSSTKKCQVCNRITDLLCQVTSLNSNSNSKLSHRQVE